MGYASAPNGNAGTWLLDPYNITIAAGAGVNTNNNCVGSPLTCTPTNDSTIFADNISAALSAGTSVFITTGTAGASLGDITVNGAITMNTFVGSATLTLQAAANVLVNAAITAAGGSILNLVLNSDSDANNEGAVRIESTITTNGGIINVGGGALVSGLPSGASYGGAFGGPSSPHGIILKNATVDAGGGNISMWGIAGVSQAWEGIDIESSVIQTNQSGTISLRGVGSNSQDSHGIALYAGGSRITSQHGNITINGTGGSLAAGGTNNVGLSLYDASVIETTGSGNINITSRGGASGGNVNHGFGLFGASTVRAAGTGSINVTATAGGVGTSANNYGFYLNNGTVLTKSGNIVVNAIATTATGLFNEAFSTAVAATNGIGDATTTGNITIYSDTYAIDGFSARTTGNLALAPYTYSMSVGVMGGAGLFQITNALLSYFTAGSYTFGKTTGSAALTANARAWTLPVTLLNGSGDININGLQDMGANAFVARTTGAGDVILGAAGAISSSAAGNNIILATGRNFLNNSLVATPLSTGTGKYLIYSSNPTDSVFGTLTSDYMRYSCVYLGTCPALGVGNGFLYSMTPNLTITPNAVSITAGNAAPITSYAYTASNYLPGDAALDTIGGSIDGSTTYTVASPAGTYNINYAAGTLTSALGYGFVYANNPTAITVSPAPSGGGGGGGGATTNVNPVPIVIIPDNPVSSSPLPASPPPQVSEPSAPENPNYDSSEQIVDIPVIDSIGVTDNEFPIMPTTVRKNVQQPTMVGCVFSDSNTKGSNCLISQSVQ